MIEIKGETIWDQQDTDCRPCSNCHTPIFSDMFVMCVYLNETTKVETQVVLCESCLEFIKESNDKPPH